MPQCYSPIRDSVCRLESETLAQKILPMVASAIISLTSELR
jgi:hypothetical protein